MEEGVWFVCASVRSLSFVRATSPTSFFDCRRLRCHDSFHIHRSVATLIGVFFLFTRNNSFSSHSLDDWTRFVSNSPATWEIPWGASRKTLSHFCFPFGDSADRPFDSPAVSFFTDSVDYLCSDLKFLRGKSWFFENLFLIFSKSINASSPSVRKKETVESSFSWNSSFLLRVRGSFSRLEAPRGRSDSECCHVLDFFLVISIDFHRQCCSRLSRS